MGKLVSKSNPFVSGKIFPGDLIKRYGCVYIYQKMRHTFEKHHGTSVSVQPGVYMMFFKKDDSEKLISLGTIYPQDCENIGYLIQYLNKKIDEAKSFVEKQRSDLPKQKGTLEPMLLQLRWENVRQHEEGILIYEEIITHLKQIPPL